MAYVPKDIVHVNLVVGIVVLDLAAYRRKRLLYRCAQAPRYGYHCVTVVFGLVEVCRLADPPCNESNEMH